MARRESGPYIASVFWTCETVAAQILIDEGLATKIEFDAIPDSVRYNNHGEPARFAVMMPQNLVPRFDRLVADLRI